MQQTTAPSSSEPEHVLRWSLGDGTVEWTPEKGFWLHVPASDASYRMGDGVRVEHGLWCPVVRFEIDHSNRCTAKLSLEPVPTPPPPPKIFIADSSGTKSSGGGDDDDDEVDEQDQQHAVRVYVGGVIYQSGRQRAPEPVGFLHCDEVAFGAFCESLSARYGAALEALVASHVLARKEIRPRDLQPWAPFEYALCSEIERVHHYRRCFDDSCWHDGLDYLEYLRPLTKRIVSAQETIVWE
ncbi:Hypothetical protein UVM_LOCUS38 [uncultured virus]|nr:Hypothetical protein UVM_LOCUS38 [uncultured virus]